MKKIMKKVLSLALVVALAIAPMTVMAAGTYDEPATLVVGETANEVELTTYSETYYYSYTPTTDGKLTLTQNCSDVYVQIQGSGVYNNFDYNPANGYTTESVTVDLVAGNTYTVSVMTSTFQAGTVSFYATFAAKGTYNNPATLVVGETANEVELTTYSETYYYSYTPTTDGKLTLTQNCSDVYVQIQGSGVYNNFDYNPANGYTTESVTVDLTAGNTYIISAMTSTFQAGTVSFKATYEESSGGSGNVANGTTPETALTINAAYIELFEGKITYYKTAVTSGATYVIDLYSMTGASFDLYTYNPRSMSYVYNTSATNGTLSAIVQSSGNELVFGVYSDEGIYIRASVTEYVEDDGTDETTPGSSYDNPEVVTTLGTITQDTPTGETYWYQWTATADGVLTVTTTTDGAHASVFCVNGEYDYIREDLENGRAAMVKEGDVVVYYVNPGGLTSANITTSFEAGASIEQNENEDDGQGDVQVNYNKGGNLKLDANEYTVDASYAYTVFTFEPTETGKYTISSTDSLLGIVSYNGMWITVGSSTTNVDPTTVTENEISWECTGVGQSIWVAAKPDTGVANITVTRVGDATDNTLTTTEYKNTTTPSAFTFTGDADKIQYVDIENDTIDKAVLGSDGYYHLNTEDGPILFVNFADQLMNLASVAENGQFTAVVYDENGAAVSKVDYNAAVNEYLACIDSETSLYPLTADLVEILQKVGADKGWYSAESQFAVGTKADAWMFACYYQEGLTSLATSPSTGDSANVAVWAIVIVVAAGAAFVVAESKRRAR